MIKNGEIFLYGPQTSGKTTRLLRIIKRDHGKDILMSGEDHDQVNNGREVCDITLRVPKQWNPRSRDWFLRNVKKQLPVKHVLIDGAQFMSKADVVNITMLMRMASVNVPIIFAGCRYYIAVGHGLTKELPTSHFLMKWCQRTIPVDRKCDFCNRVATRLHVRSFKHLSAKKIVAVDPHLLCDVHYRKLHC